ncbi:MAG TPA: GNAT family N-acetyltransferase [Actinospica sp.]|nr:GNAT family N-acetyltransferase [Actinospica sp.]
MSTTTDRADAYALLTDGRCVHVRSVTPEDWQAVYDFAATLGRESLYRRFFSVPSHPGETLADVLCSPRVEQSPPTQGALIALLDGEAVGLAEWYRTGGRDEAEIAFEVSDALHGHGVATLLAEHLMLAAHRAGIRRLTAITLGENRPMIGVFLALGVPVGRDWQGSECLWTIPIDHAAFEGEAALDAAARRESVADEASLSALFAPGSIAVLGEGGDPRTEAVLRNLAGFDGPVFRDGSLGELLAEDARPDLAVVTSPPQWAVPAARRCARARARALIVTATGFTPELGRELLDVCHESGMRLVGPGSLGVASPGGDRGFSALLAEEAPEAGNAGVAVQSGGVGLALLRHLRRLGIGVSTFAAVGEKYDVSANDLLMHWEHDGRTRFGLLHVESFGNPRKFARTARRLSRRIPLLAVDPEQAPSEARTALYAQAGIVALPSLGALVDAAALAEHQPLPDGSRVAVLGTTHGMVTLAAQACLRAGLEVAATVNLTPAAGPEALTEAVAATAGRADALLIALAPTVPHALDPLAAAAAAGQDTAVLAVRADQPESVRILCSDGDSAVRLPCYDDSAAAAGALAALVRAAEVLRRPVPEPAVLEQLDLGAARTLIEGWLAEDPLGRDLAPEECARLLAAVGVPATEPAAGPAATVTAWQDPVFGPLLSANHGREARTVLIPFDAREAAALAADQGLEKFALLRLSVLLEACPELAALRVDFHDGTAAAVSGALAPAPTENPYLRRLRRAPVE